MARIIKPGRVAPSEPPPPGLRADCPQCGSILETTYNEPEAEATLSENGPAGGRVYTPGWEIPCPGCGQKVFFKRES